MDLIEIDGSRGEGGGQVIRVAAGLSAVTGKPFRVTGIRANRPRPGLMPQHLKGIEAVAKLCDARVSGLSEGSTTLEFSPGRLGHADLRIDIGTAGSITLALQGLMIPAVLTEKPLEFDITGGTDVRWSPTFAYFQSVFCGNLKGMGIQVEAEALKAGYYPKGGGRARVRASPSNGIRPVGWTEQGATKRIDCWSFAAEGLANVAERQMKGFEETFPRIGCRDVHSVDALSPGSSITAHAHCTHSILGAAALGELGKKAEAVGRECAGLLRKQLDSKACLDVWMADQILPYLALAKGKSAVTVPELTGHAQTNMDVIRKFLDVEFSVSGTAPVRIACSGSSGPTSRSGTAR
jgi:RNA 3'-phosphate cyclase